MVHLKRTAVLLIFMLTGCGGGGGGDGNAERVLAVLPVSYDFSIAPSTDPLPYCFGVLPCADMGTLDQLGVTLTLALIDENTTPGTQTVVDAVTDPNFQLLVNFLTDGTLGPLAAGLLVNGQSPGCIGDDEGDLQLQEQRPVPAPDLLGFEITGVALVIDSVSKTTTQVSLSGRVIVFGRTAALP